MDLEEKNTPDFGMDDSSEDISSNPTNNPTFREIAAKHVSRRSVLAGSLATAAAGYLAPTPGHAHDSWSRHDNGYKQWRKKPLLDFESLTKATVQANGSAMPNISPDWEYDVLIPWGTPIDPYAGITPYEGDPNTRPTAAEQEQMIGIGHDGMWLFPSNLPYVLRYESRRGRELPSHSRGRILSNRSGMLCINHEFGSNSHVIGKTDPDEITAEDVRLSQAAHGVSCVLVGRSWSGKWELRHSRKNRRITAYTPMKVSGPAADSACFVNAANNEVAGTINNCGSGATPWGTYVTCEENFNGYFGSTEFGREENNDNFNAWLDGILNDPATSAEEKLRIQGLQRYGFDRDGFGYWWHEHDPRFDLSNPDYENEAHRFGWCVEIDPFKPHAKPVKRTALGRVKHEAVAFKELDDGRVACYMGDDQRGDYCYKFESKYPWRKAIKKGKSPLDEGKLYVAKFEEVDPADADGEGKGEWIELTCDNPAIAAAGLDTQDKVLIYARLAADAVGATRMDRPEWTTVGTEGQVFWTLTNNDQKDTAAADTGNGAVNESNPIFENEDGQIISTKDISSTAFKWKLFILARNTRRPDDPGITVSGDDMPYAVYQEPADGGEAVFTDPDAAWADPFGRLYIGTDGGQPDGLQDQLLVFDVNTGESKRILSGVSSDEITGLTSTPDYQTLFTNIQHPGNGSPTSTNFPALPDGATIPRDATLVLRRKYRKWWEK